MTTDPQLPDAPARDEKFIRFCGVVSRAAAALILVGCSLSLFAPLFPGTGFLRGSLYEEPMSPATTFAYLLSAVSLWFLREEHGGRAARFLVDVCAASVSVSGAVTLFRYVLGGYALDGIFPLWMISPITSLSFILAGGAVLLVHRRRGGFAASWMIVGACVLGILGLTGYAYNVEVLVRIGIPSHISFLSVTLSVLLGIGLLAGMRDQGMMGFLSRDSAGSIMARRLLPALVFVPILFGLFRQWGESIGLFDGGFGVGFMVLSSMAALALVVWANAVWLNRYHLDGVRSERLRARQAEELRRTTDLLEKVFSNIRLNVAILDPDFNVLRVNREFADSFRHPADHYIARNLFDFFGDDEVETLFRKAVEAGEPRTGSAQPHVSREAPEKGMTFWDWSLQPVRDAGGKVSELVLSLSDVTEKMRAETLLRVEEMLRARQGEELRQTAELLEKIFSNIYLNIVYMDTQFNILRMNQTAADYAGRPLSWFVGKNYFDQFPDEETEAIFRGVVETGEPASASARPYKSREHPERSETYWDWTLQPIKEKDGRVGGLILSTLNVTERVEAQARLREREEAEVQAERMAALGLMAAGIAHEVRNPLTGLNFSLAAAESICAASETLDPGERESLARSFSSARASSVRIGEVIRRVMNFARPGRVVSECADINGAIREALQLSAATLRKKGIRLEAALSDEVPPCPADSRGIEQLVLNLVTNAAQALEDGQGERRIVVSSRMEGDRILISVADSGPGVPEELREKIFTPFFTTRKSGTGLGLPISRKIAADHGGTIRVETGRLGGAEFLVSIPARGVDRAGEQR